MSLSRPSAAKEEGRGGGGGGADPHQLLLAQIHVLPEAQIKVRQERPQHLTLSSAEFFYMNHEPFSCLSV